MNKSLKNTKNTSIALGFFDGVHFGHEKVLNNALSYAKKLGTESSVLTFKNHPIEIIRGIIPEFITTPEERFEKFKKMGFNKVIMQDFSQDIYKMSAEEYFYNIIMKFSPKSISIGYNHKFGNNQSGDEYFLTEMSKKHDFILNVIEPVKYKNETISSTLIRNYIKDGNVKMAYNLMREPYSVKNTVTDGMKRGRTINFPTANIEFPTNKIIPRFGVYAGYTFLDDKKYLSVANVGVRPTFEDINIPIIEIHILNFSDDIYGQTIKFEFVEKIRDEVKFRNVEQLKEQIEKDIIVVNNILK